MAYVNLPNMDAVLDEPDQKKQMEMIVNTYGRLMKNLSELNGYLSNSNIRAKTIKAEKMDVDELSAISADLGEITAGIIRGIQIFGSYIATREGTYPRVELNDSGNLLAVYLDADNSIRFVPGATTSPNIEFYNNGSLAGTIKMLNFGLEVALAGTFFHVTGGDLFVDNVNNISDGITTIGMLLNGKANSFTGYTGNVTAGTSTMHFTNGILTSVT